MIPFPMAPEAASGPPAPPGRPSLDERLATIRRDHGDDPGPLAHYPPRIRAVLEYLGAAHQYGSPEHARAHWARHPERVGMSAEARRIQAREDVRHGLPVGQPPAPLTESAAVSLVLAVFPGAQVTHRWVRETSGGLRCTVTGERRTVL